MRGGRQSSRYETREFAAACLLRAVKFRGRREFPVAPPGSLAHHPRMIRDKSGKDPARQPKGVIAVALPSFRRERALIKRGVWPVAGCDEAGRGPLAGDRKSTRLNSSHGYISYAVFCLK